jgi:hypothetical protein
MGHTNARLGRAFLLLFDGSLRTLLARVCDYNLIALLRKEDAVSSSLSPHSMAAG